jgi:hypothetical protein
MKWSAIVAVAALSWFLMAVANRRKNLRATVTIYIPESGEPIVSTAPEDIAPEIFLGLLLSYGSKLWWNLLTEPLAVQEQFKILVEELVMAWPLAGESLILAMPIAASAAAVTDRPHAAPGGERFVVRYYRTRYRKLRDVGSIVNSLPRPGLASNIAWNYIVLGCEIFHRLDVAERARAAVALELWKERILSPECRDSSLAGLRRLMTEADYALEAPRGSGNSADT